ncbi:MAG: pilus assembly protein TadG-related protein [Candidatus Limnocylindrales bacterium]
MIKPVRRDGQRGQALVLFALALTALLASTALVVDVGNVWAQQRATQNGTDASAEAGTVVLAQYFECTGGCTAPPATQKYCPTITANAWDLAICEATYGMAATDGVTLAGAKYVDPTGTIVLGDVGGGALPALAQGVRALGTRNVATSFARVVGVNSWTVSTQATAVTAVASALCPVGAACNIFPITVPVTVSTCSNSGKLTPGDANWPIVGSAQMTGNNESIVPVCKNQNATIGGGSSGSVGWLDLTTALGVTLNPNAPGCGGNGAGNITAQITGTCITGLTFPTWIQTISGGVGKGGPAVDTALNAYSGDTVAIPQFDGTCNAQPTKATSNATADCLAVGGSPGVGVNTWYHVPGYYDMVFGEADFDGSARNLCTQSPGKPTMTKGGGDACFKGWWTQGFVPGTSFTIGGIIPGPNQNLGVQLIR